VLFLSATSYYEDAGVFETLVSSRIRRTLLAYLLAHPNERFYLRGLAKTLQLTVTPLRRELKRLEAAGVLRASQEGKRLVYAVNQASPLFAQLKHAVQPLPAPANPNGDVPNSLPDYAAHTLRFANPFAHPTSWRLSWAGILGLGTMVAIGGSFAVLISSAQRHVNTKPLNAMPRALLTMTPDAGPSHASGELRSAKLRLVPGAMGGLGAWMSRDEHE